MSAGGSSKQDFELNLASIIDCFTVLITYLLVSASFISLGAFSVTVAAVDDQVHPDTPLLPYVNVSVMLQKDQTMGIQVESNDISKNTTINIPKKNEEKDWDALLTQIAQMKERYAIASILVGAEDTIAYKDIVLAVSKIQTVLPQIALSAEGI